ncbi:MAG: hypothetical protein AB7N65_21405 [Vicinamibacterales bacterium]
MITSHPSATEVTFRVRPLGFDKGEVQAFITNLLNDYTQVTRELERLRSEMAALREFSSERRPTEPQPTTQAVPPVVSASTTTAREVERILAGAERIAEEMRARATEESETLLRESKERAAALVREAEDQAARRTLEADTLATAAIQDADARSTASLEDAEARAAALLRDAEQRAAAVLRDAETRAADLVEGAAQHVLRLDGQAATIRAQWTTMRTALQAATDAASSALQAIDTLEEEPEPALEGKRR